VGTDDNARRYRWVAATGAVAPAKRRCGRGNKRHGEVLCTRTKPLGVSGRASVARVAKLSERPLMATRGRARRRRAGVQACEDKRVFCRRDGRLPSWP
jgi:hypothetical protein